jgi:DNA-binding transcriptional LysR family regulator
VTLRQFEVFLAVARAHSFRRAAETLHLSQPALSQHVRELEGALGARLFDRLGRAVHLTEAGRILEDHATRLFATLTDAQHAIADLQGLQRGTLTIGASTTPGIYVLPEVLGVFRQQYPGIEIVMQLGNSEQVAAMVRAGELGLGVVDDGGTSEARVAARVEDELVLVVGPTHAWARRRDISSAELAGQPLLMREPGSATRQVTERALAETGWLTSPAWSCRNRSHQAGRAGRPRRGIRVRLHDPGGASHGPVAARPDPRPSDRAALPPDAPRPAAPQRGRPRVRGTFCSHCPVTPEPANWATCTVTLNCISSVSRRIASGGIPARPPGPPAGNRLGDALRQLARLGIRTLG